MVQTDSKIRLGFIDDVEEIYVASEDVYLQRDITDKDGDGVEDNVKMSHHELDKFIKPFVYGDVEEMHNTRNGELPGHHLKNDHPEPTGDHASTIPDLRNVKSSAAEVVAEAKKNAPKEEKKEEKAAAPAAAEGEKKAEEKKEDKPAEEKKVQMTSSISEIDDERADSEGDSEYNADGAKVEEQAQALPQVKKIDVSDPVVSHQIVEGAAITAFAESESDERAQSEYDAEYTQTKVSSFVNQIQSPEDLTLVANDVSLLQTGWCLGCNDIYDADGDGVEDNRHLTSNQIDKFETPNVFNTAEEIYNTRNGELPGHIQKEFYDSQDEPTEVPS